ncbi:MAG: tetratricopeptide repeat protein [Bryobacteraceae bacterium]
MIRFFLPAVLFLAGCCISPAAEQGQLDASPSLFSVMAAINAAGYDADIDSAANHPLRETLRRELSSRNIPCLPELKKFFAEHRQLDDTSELSQYISFALITDGPPSFQPRVKQNEIPPDVLALNGFDKLMTRFHSEAGIDDLWRKVQPAIDGVIERYHEPVTRAVTEVNSYLRAASGGYFGRRFQIYVDLMAAPHHIQSRSYLDEYFIVLTPSPEPQVEDIRHAYLHYMIDPLATKYSEDVMAKKSLGDLVLAAGALEDYYKSDFLLLTTESLIKAIESRLAPASKRQAMVDQALHEGFILTPYFAEKLVGFEKEDRAMRLYFQELVKAINLGDESRRLANVEFLEKKPIRKAKVVPAERKVEPTGPYKTLEDAENAYRARDYGKARELHLRLLEESGEKPLHAKAYYGLARIAALQNDPELAERLFQKTLELDPEPQDKAWAFVYLGRLADLANLRKEAGAYYKAALDVNGGSAAARKAAQQGLQDSFGKDK